MFFQKGNCNPPFDLTRPKHISVRGNTFNRFLRQRPSPLRHSCSKRALGNRRAPFHERHPLRKAGEIAKLKTIGRQKKTPKRHFHCLFSLKLIFFFWFSSFFETWSLFNFSLDKIFLLVLEASLGSWTKKWKLVMSSSDNRKQVYVYVFCLC